MNYMKIVPIGLICLSLCICVKKYIGRLKSRGEFASDWSNIFRTWRDSILHFSFSVDELIAYISENASTSSLSASLNIKDKSLEEIIVWIKTAEAEERDRQTVLDVLSKVGESFKETEAESLAHAADSLRESASANREKVKEKQELLYKLTPLLCGAIAILLW